MKRVFLMCMAAMLAMTACGGNNAAAEQQSQAPVGATASPVHAVTEWTGADRLEPVDIPMVIDFNADWCGPCRAFGPVFHELAGKYQSKARFVSVNVDRYEGIARQFGVRGIPQVTVLYPDGQVTTHVGYMTADQFEAFLVTALRR